MPWSSPFFHHFHDIRIAFSKTPNTASFGISLCNFHLGFFYNSSKESLMYFRFFAALSANSLETKTQVDIEYSMFNDYDIAALHKLLWAKQENIGQYLSVNRLVAIFFEYFV